MATKTENAAGVAAGLLTEVFHHSHLGVINISEIRRFAYHLPREVCRIDAAAVEMLRKNREIDDERVASLTPAQRDEPCIFVRDPGPDGRFEPIDGVHRIARRVRDGFDTVECCVVPIDLLPAFRIDDNIYRFVERPWGTMEVTPQGLKPRKET